MRSTTFGGDDSTDRCWLIGDAKVRVHESLELGVARGIFLQGTLLEVPLLQEELKVTLRVFQLRLRDCVGRLLRLLLAMDDLLT